MIVGEIIEMKTQVYICVNEQGTLEHLQQVNPVRLLLWHFRNALLQRPIESLETVAKQSYRIADAILEARKK